MIEDTCICVKTFRSGRGDESRREVLGLLLASRCERPLAPRVLHWAPRYCAVAMESWPGNPLEPNGATVGTLVASGSLLRAMHEIPVRPGERLPRSYGHPALVKERLDRMSATWTGPALDRETHLAMEQIARWLGSGEAQALVRPAALAVGQGDTNPANVVVGEEGLRLVDFEDAGLTDPLCDLAHFVEHVRASSSLHIDAVVDGYECTGAEQAALVSRRRLFASWWLHLLLPGRPGGPPRNPPSALRRQARRVLWLLG